jgi:hypothetical protein
LASFILQFRIMTPCITTLITKLFTNLFHSDKMSYQYRKLKDILISS